MKHTVYFNASQKMSQLQDHSVDLVVTSPPYPMIEMWDGIMSAQNSAIKESLDANQPRQAFELMHQELDKVWSECWRVLKNGSFLCINIGDATRSVNGEFALYNNNTRIIQACERLGFVNLPNILWKKTTNAPNKFMGSGMLPCGAYVTLEHEWILIFRKGAKREYKTDVEKDARRECAYFWEERNVWFSDIWEITGVRQTIDNAPSRSRNASFPIELPYRLINMFSQKGDMVLDPFMGLGTTAIASILCERNSVGYEIDGNLMPLLLSTFQTVSMVKANHIIHERYKRHLSFVAEREKANKEVKYENHKLSCKVMTAQETELCFHYLKSIDAQAVGSHLEIDATYYPDRPLSDMPLAEKGTLFEMCMAE